MSVTVPPQPIYEGTSTAITCSAIIDAAVDTPFKESFEWYFEGADDFSESRFSFSETSTSTQMFESMLHFDPISIGDSGTYSCSVVIESLTQHVEDAEGGTNAEVIVNGITQGYLSMYLVQGQHEYLHICPCALYRCPSLTMIVD